MNQQILSQLGQMKTETDEYLKRIDECLDLSINHDDPNHIANQIHDNCNHPVYYLYGFYKALLNDGKLEEVLSSEFNCDYALLRCLECGEFLKIDKPEHGHLEWYCTRNGKKIKVMQRKQTYKELRKQYFMYCVSSNASETEAVNKFQKLYLRKNQIYTQQF